MDNKFTKETRGIGTAGADTVWAMYKQRFPQEIDFDSDDFVKNLCDILSIYRKNKEFNFKDRVVENIKMSRRLTRLDGKYLPEGYEQILYDTIKI